MEHPLHPLTVEQSDFMSKLRYVMSGHVYFFGSILRSDYIEGESDIDLMYFSDNIDKASEDMYQFMINYSNNNPNVKVKVRPFLYKSKDTHYKYSSGYKLKYIDPENSIPIEIIIHPVKYKEIVRRDKLALADASFIYILFLKIIRWLKKYGLLPKEITRMLKAIVIDINRGYSIDFKVFPYW